MNGKQVNWKARLRSLTGGWKPYFQGVMGGRVWPGYGFGMILTGPTLISLSSYSLYRPPVTAIISLHCIAPKLY